MSYEPEAGAKTPADNTDGVLVDDVVADDVVADDLLVDSVVAAS